MAQPMGSAVGSSSPSVARRPAEQEMQRSAGRGRGRGGASSSGGPSNLIYALTGRQDSETPPNADAGTLLFFSRNICVLTGLDFILWHIFISESLMELG